eukprot:6153632-Karenia_brevis.AAC.1
MWSPTSGHGLFTAVNLALANHGIPVEVETSTSSSAATSAAKRIGMDASDEPDAPLAKKTKHDVEDAADAHTDVVER